MKQLLNNINGLHGEVFVPGDKSISHRSIILGSISHGVSQINHFLFSDDCLRTIEAFRQMGIQIEINTNNDQVTIHGKGMHGLKSPQNALNMGNSGTTTRLLSGLLSAQDFNTELFGDDSLSERPMNRVIVPLSKMGATIQDTEGHLPMSIKGHELKSIDYDLPIASAQVKSALILASLYVNQDSIISGQKITRDHTERMLNQFGSNVVVRNGNKITIHSQPKLNGQSFEVPGDISSAAFFMVAATLIPNSNILLKNVGINPTRIGIIKILKKMNANIKLINIKQNVEPIADIKVKTAKQLDPIKINKQDIPSMIDELPLVAILAARANGTSTIHGAEELRVKETDRIDVLVQELSKMGIDISGLEDGFTIHGSLNWEPNSYNLDSHNDHRIGMTLAIASLLIDNQFILKNDSAINISYPNFFDDLIKLIRR